ncbi:MAG: reverse transcriptase domain-containing protein [Defluviicoccus sp.]|nr:reverse transcriptase domain-containing protein [Defluviicoccus sp.]
MGNIELEVRKIDNLYRAWSVVRSNVNTSGHDKFKAEVKRISENPIPHLRRIQSDLQHRRFVFDGQQGVVKKKSSGGKRPIVVAPINNRIVQRAILNVLQCDDDRIASQLGMIGTALRTPTSVGGIPRRGVAYGIEIVTEAIKSGATHYLRSDIRDFFTTVPKPRVIQFVQQQTTDEDFVALFEQAMTTELANADEVKDYLYLFPLADIGIPQGSSLSAFAGNVVLRNFDAQLNGRNITTVRYIDDFVILGPTERAVKKAFCSAVSILGDLGMTAYSPDENREKSKLGAIADGFDFLGCSVRINGVAPSRKARQNLLDDIRHTLSIGGHTVEKYASSGERRRAEEAFAQIICSVDRKIRGWGDAFSFSNDRLPFDQMDERIDCLLLEFKGRANSVIRKACSDGKRRALGVALLKDTPKEEKAPPVQIDQSPDSYRSGRNSESDGLHCDLHRQNKQGVPIVGG